MTVRLTLMPSEAGSPEAIAAVCREAPGTGNGVAELLAFERSSDAGTGALAAAAFASALEAIPDGVYVGTLQGIVHCNQAALAMLGAASVQDLKTRIDELGRRFRVRRERTGPPAPPEELPFVRALNGESAVLETWATRPDGSDVFIRGTAAPIRIDGEVVGAVAVNSDLTDRLLLEEAAQEARAQAERANRLKDDFLAVVSHELRTPLSAMVNWASLLQRSLSDPPPLVQKGLDALLRNAQLQSNLVDDLLDVGRIESGQLRLERQPLELVDVIAGAVDSVLPSAEAKGIRMQVDMDPGPALVFGDPSRLQQVVWNLLANAVKFTPNGGSVRVTLRQDDGTVTIRVSDSGQGIAPAFLPHVFERFRQEEATQTRRLGGLGLGLSIVHDLVQLHGGSVSADSAGPGQGATFEIRLPRHADDRGQP